MSGWMLEKRMTPQIPGHDAAPVWTVSRQYENGVLKSQWTGAITPRRIRKAKRVVEGLAKALGWSPK